MLEYFIIVVMNITTPNIETGQPIFMFNNSFESYEECMAELHENSNTYFLKASMAFKGLPPKLANCVDSNIVEEIKSLNIHEPEGVSL